MKTLVNKLSIREIFLFGLTLSAVAFFLGIKYYILPAQNKRGDLKAKAQLMSVEYDKLLTNLKVSEKMGQEYDILRNGAVVQTESDQITLSTFLQEIEVAARRPSLVLINMKPKPVATGETYKTYPVRLSVSGRFPEVIGFVSDLLSTQNVIGIEHFMLRGGASYGRVECSMEPYMIKTIPLARHEGGA